MFHHIKILEDAKIIEKKEVKEGDKWKRGKQVEIITNYENLESLKRNEEKYLRSRGILPDDGWMPKSEKRILFDIFKIIKKKGKPTDFWEIRKRFPDKKYKKDELEITGEIQAAFMNSPELFLYDISEDGEEKFKELEKELNNNSKITKKQ